jgi:Tfp pilus assembly protein FimT
MKQKILNRKLFHSPTFFPLQRKLYSRQLGYSLLENIILLALIGILSSIAAPKTSQWIENYRLSGATRLVWGDLQNAKMTAIKNNQSITVIFDTATSYSFSQAGSTIFTRNLNQEYPGITVTKSLGGVLTFESTGMSPNATTTPITITIQGSEKTKFVTTYLTGRIIST